MGGGSLAFPAVRLRGRGNGESGLHFQRYLSGGNTATSVHSSVATGSQVTLSSFREEGSAILLLQKGEGWMYT